jgi:hypothetical protein
LAGIGKSRKHPDRAPRLLKTEDSWCRWALRKVHVRRDIYGLSSYISERATTIHPRESELPSQSHLRCRLRMNVDSVSTDLRMGNSESSSVSHTQRRYCPAAPPIRAEERTAPHIDGPKYRREIEAETPNIDPTIRNSESSSVSRLQPKSCPLCRQFALKRSHELLLLLNRLEPTVTVLGGSVDKFESNVLLR